MQDIFKFHKGLMGRYNKFSQGFNTIWKKGIRDIVDRSTREFRPESIIQVNMDYKRGGLAGELVREGSWHLACERIFAHEGRLVYSHQQQAIDCARGTGITY